MTRTICIALRRVSLALGAVAGAGTAILMLTVVPDLVARGVFGEAVYGMSETGIFLLVLIVYLGLAAAQVRRELFYVGVADTFVSPARLRWLLLVRYLVSAAIAAAFAWFATLGAIDSTSKGESSYAVIAYPIWPAKIVVAFGLALLALQFLVEAIELWSNGLPDPVAGRAGS